MKKKMRVASSTKLTEAPAVIIGIVTSSIISIFLTVALTSLVMNGGIGELATDPYIFAIRTVATAIGCFVGNVLMKGKFLLITGMVALGYLVILLGMGIILYDGSFKNILSGGVSVLIGGMVACLAVLKPLKKSKHKVRYGR